MRDDLARAMKLNGMIVKRPLRELHEIGLQRPTEFHNGIAFLGLNVGFIAVGIFFECEPDAWYFFEPNEDTKNQIRESA